MADLIKAITDSVVQVGLTTSLIILVVIAFGWYLWYNITKENKSSKLTIEKQNAQLELANTIMKTAILDNRDMSDKQLIAINTLIVKLETLENTYNCLLKNEVSTRIITQTHLEEVE
jgi:hypothetical protein